MLGDVGFYIDGGEEEEQAESEADGDVWCLPPRGSVRGLSDGENSEGEAGHDGESPGVVHFDVARGRFPQSRVWD